MELKRILENYLFGNIKAKVISENSWHFRRRRFEILVNVLSQCYQEPLTLILLVLTFGCLGIVHFIFSSTFYIYKRDLRSGVIG